jgi:hypothetical protein
MIIKEDMKYTQLLDLQWALRRQEIHAKTHWDEMYKSYGSEELLTKLAYGDLKELREASKTMERVIDILRDNDLYTNGD